jgi:hypothetical protein
MLATTINYSGRKGAKYLHSAIEDASNNIRARFHSGSAKEYMCRCIGTAGLRGQ